jgi:hypothetical protein
MGSMALQPCWGPPRACGRRRGGEVKEEADFVVTRSSGHDFNKSGKLSISWTSFAAITKPIPRRQTRYQHDTYERLISSNTLTATRRMAHPQNSGKPAPPSADERRCNPYSSTVRDGTSRPWFEAAGFCMIHIIMSLDKTNGIPLQCQTTSPLSLEIQNPQLLSFRQK